MLTNTHRHSHRVILDWKYVQLGSQRRGRRNFQFREFSWDRKRGSLNVLNRDSWKEAFIRNILLCLELLSKISRRCGAAPIHSSFVFTDGTPNSHNMQFLNNTTIAYSYCSVFLRICPVSADSAMFFCKN